MLRSASRLYLWLMILVVEASVSFYLLWVAVNGSQGTEDRQVGTSAAASVTGLSRSRDGARHQRFRCSVDAPPPSRSTLLYYGKDSVPNEFQRWSSSAERTCSGRLIGYGHEFALLKSVVVNSKYCRCQRRGGEPINAVLNQEESVEYCNVDVGCFQLPCIEFQPYSFNVNNKHLNSWMGSLKTGRDVAGVDVYQIDEFTIAVQRYEYVNLYHTMTDWYNAFLMMQFFGRTAEQTNILIFDGHPYGSLDPVWPQLFNSTFRLSALPSITHFQRLVWSIIGYNSPMKVFLSPYPPLLEEFRSFFLSSYDVDADRRVDCGKLSVLFIWRRDYMAHPRNPTGFVTRKVRNEAQLIRFVREKMPELGQVRGVQIDALPMRDQLRLIVAADFLVGIHGAGLTHAIFLPRGAALLELVPNAKWSVNKHFEAIASWRQLAYQQWTNNDFLMENKSQGTLIVPPNIVTASIQKLHKQICPTLAIDDL